MNKISCDICLDLIPLVNDDVASEDSGIAVKEHINKCESCKIFYDGENFQDPKMNDNLVVSKIKRQLYFASLIIIVFGAILGIALTEGMGMFYNILIMPTIGAIGYFALGKKSYYVPLTLSIFMYVWLLIKYAVEGMFKDVPFMYGITIPMLWVLIYSGLCLLGIVIGFLLEIAFRKEGENEKND